MRVWDDNDEPSCIDAEVEVVAVPSDAIHVELVWHTPDDTDQTDEGVGAGADLDLHLLHPFATGPDLDEDGQPEGWFDVPFDAYFANPHPDWGSKDPVVDDNPSVDRDDSDGAGPEIITIAEPEDGVVYRVGVHYWGDHDFGPSLATVRVYIMGQLVFQESGVGMVEEDLWEVGSVAWPSGKVTLATGAGGSHKIFPGYTPFSPTD